VLVRVSWLARKLIIIFAIIAIILITIISTMLRFSLTTILLRVFIGGLVFALIGGILGEIIYQNINSSDSQVSVTEEELEGTDLENSSQIDREDSSENSNMEPLQFEELNNDDNNVVNNIDAEQGAEIIKEMSQDN
jgi:uncharacterized membrane protein YraQ (UPF0718 family)